MPQSQVFSQVESDLQNKRFSAAMMKLTRVSNSCSRDLQYLGLLAQTQKALGDVRGLTKTFRVIAGITTSAASFLDLMYILYTQGSLNEALDVGLQLQDMKLTTVQERSLVHGLVRIYLELSDYEGVQETVDMYPSHQDDTLISWALGLVQLAAGEKDSALTLFRRSVELNSANDRAWISLALLHDEMGDRELALANLERALDVNPQNPTGLRLMAKWQSNPKQSRNLIGRFRYYLDRHDFDEEMSLCYIQVLKDSRFFHTASFEIDKLILSNPRNHQYQEMKKNLEDAHKV